MRDTAAEERRQRRDLAWPGEYSVESDLRKQRRMQEELRHGKTHPAQPPVPTITSVGLPRQENPRVSLTPRLPSASSERRRANVPRKSRRVHALLLHPPVRNV